MATIQPSHRDLIEDLFNVYGLAAILNALAVRCSIEGAIAHGEGREDDSRHWGAFATTLLDVATEAPGESAS